MTGIERVVLEVTGKVLLGLGAYALVARRFAEIVQPLRLKMAVGGEQILATQPPRERADLIEFCLDNAFSGWVMPYAALLFPLAVISGVAKYAAGRP